MKDHFFVYKSRLKRVQNILLQVLCTQKLVLDTQKLLLGTKPTICFFASNHKSYQNFCFWHVLDNFCRRRSDPFTKYMTRLQYNSDFGSESAPNQRRFSSSECSPAMPLNTCFQPKRVIIIIALNCSSSKNVFTCNFM